MAATATSSLSISSTSTLIDGKAPPPTHRQSATQCVALPTLSPPPIQPRIRIWKATGGCQNMARNVIAMATGEVATGEAPTEVEATEFPEVIKPIQEAWEKVEDKYAVSSLVVASVVGLYVSIGIVSAIDRIPILPGVLELVGIGYTGWFAYKNLFYKPDREALLAKIKGTYDDIIGRS